MKTGAPVARAAGASCMYASMRRLGRLNGTTGAVDGRTAFQCRPEHLRRTQSVPDNMALFLSGSLDSYSMLEDEIENLANATSELNTTACRLCLRARPLRDSHIIPAFVYRWQKGTSATGYTRSLERPNVRVQDGPVVPLLCDAAVTRGPIS